MHMRNAVRTQRDVGPAAAVATRARRASCAAWLAGAVLVLSACAQLPPLPPRTASTASMEWEGTWLGDTARRSLPARSASGFELLPIASVAFGTRLELAAKAQHTLDAQYYALEHDATGIGLLRALRDAARRGVRVRLLVDDLLTAGQDDLLAELAAEPHAEVRLYNPFAGGRDRLFSRWVLSWWDLRRVDHRMHNKLFVADNALAVLGGRNIGDHYFMRAADSNFLDLDVLAAGPVVRELSSAFDAFWNSDFVYPIEALTKPRRADAPSSLNDVQPVHLDLDETATGGLLVERYASTASQLQKGRLTLESAAATVLFDAPDKAAETNGEPRRGKVHANLAAVIRSANDEVVVASPYFVPGPEGMEAIRELRKRGVKLRLVTNSLAATDEPLVHVGYARYRKAMLQVGCDIREIGPGLVREHSHLDPFGRSLGRLHAKIAIIDRRFVFVGSMNFDSRSQWLNTEIGVVIESPELARQILQLMSDEVTAYKLRLAADGESLEWVYVQDGRETVFTDEPEASLGRRIEFRVLGPFVPEGEL
jgi:putative cardiolipin synthase